MTKRINVILPETTVRIIDRLTPPGGRSQFINRAVIHFVQSQSASNLREQLKQEALTNAQRDMDMAKEWFPVEEEACQLALQKRKLK